MLKFKINNMVIFSPGNKAKKGSLVSGNQPGENVFITYPIKISTSKFIRTNLGFFPFKQ